MSTRYIFFFFLNSYFKTYQSKEQQETGMETGVTLILLFNKVQAWKIQCSSFIFFLGYHLIKSNGWLLRK